MTERNATCRDCTAAQVDTQAAGGLDVEEGVEKLKEAVEDSLAWISQTFKKWPLRLLDLAMVIEQYRAETHKPSDREPRLYAVKQLPKTSLLFVCVGLHLNNGQPERAHGRPGSALKGPFNFLSRHKATMASHIQDILDIDSQIRGLELIVDTYMDSPGFTDQPVLEAKLKKLKEAKKKAQEDVRKTLDNRESNFN
ncbi:hypothetical protein EV426DRAFT_574027 [Tirmania nivea]|nr:hypothetical protein EV426DRAFT_574027 [Tirmania nivea]